MTVVVFPVAFFSRKRRFVLVESVVGLAGVAAAVGVVVGFINVNSDRVGGGVAVVSIKGRRRRSRWRQAGF